MTLLSATLIVPLTLAAVRRGPHRISICLRLIADRELCGARAHLHDNGPICNHVSASLRRSSSASFGPINPGDSGIVESLNGGRCWMPESVAVPCRDHSNPRFELR